MRKEPSIAIFIIAYQAASTLISAYKRIPASLKRKAKEIYCFDDCSDDNTYYAGLGYKHANNIKNFVLYKNPKNLGYGGNQKKGYNYALNKNYDIVVMLHGDAQYAPEKIPILIDPFLKDDGEEIGMVMGSRMLGDPLKGGMPIYKFFGNKILTFLENLILGTNLSEFHSGYRAFNLNALKEIPFNKCSNDFHFDTEIIIMMLQAGYKIVEVPIPTYYGPGSKSHVNVFKYGLDCLIAVINYRLSQLGIKKDSKFDFLPCIESNYQLKTDPQSSHVKIANLIRKMGARKVLDVGCGNGFTLRALGEKWRGTITGIDIDKTLTNSASLKKYRSFISLDINKNDVSKEVSKDYFDLVVLADILEHLKNPQRVLNQVTKVVIPNGYIVVSIPNPDFIPVKILRILFPKFRMSRGPLDKTHLHFFNIDQTKKILANEGLKIKEIQTTTFPFSFIIPNIFKNNLETFLIKINSLLITLSNRLFGYQFVILVQKNM